MALRKNNPRSSPEARKNRARVGKDPAGSIARAQEGGAEQAAARPELLAPAGSLAAFEAAVEKGADAVYIGAPALNARALARDFTMAEIAAMIAYGHDRGVKVYLAMNSLLREDDIPRAVEALDLFAALGADALIVQDLGLARLARQHFPGLRLHASTLMSAHNSAAVRQLEQMGFARVVLPRELTLKEIAAIRGRTSVELEAFVHGALCFSFSGLCLFSSFLGGRSGLRGQCVQPCRRRYTWAGRGKGASGGYFFSMSDLDALDLLAEIRRAGIGSFKIEGRMRSAGYVGAVVEAYRTVLDAEPGDARALGRARELLAVSMGRKPTSGYFLTSQPADALSPQHSGNIGIFLGAVAKLREGRMLLRLKHGLEVGDRIRIHHEASGERLSCTVKKMWVAGEPVAEAGPDTQAAIEAPAACRPGDAVYLVDVRDRRQGREGAGLLSVSGYDRVAREAADPARVARVLAALARPAAERRSGSGLKQWIRIDDFKEVREIGLPSADSIVVTLTRQTQRQLPGMARWPGLRSVIWALPPIILEKDLAFYEKAVAQLRRSGFLHWQIAHVGQLRLLKDRRGTISGDYRLNVLNSLSVAALADLGLARTQLAVEADRKAIAAVCAGKLPIAVGATVYGRPWLLTARLTPRWLRYGQPFISPKGESFVLRKIDGLTVAQPLKEFSLLAKLPELAQMGLAYAVVDLSQMELDKKAAAELGRQLAGKKGSARGAGTFNYLGKLE